MKLCIYSGTFNPIHRAHLQVADYVSKNYDFDKILFIPAFKPPHKDYDPKMSFHRFNMVKLATAHNPKLEVSDIEYKKEGKSYSLITVKEIIEQYNIPGKLNFLIGTDAFAKINSWYKADELKQLVHFIVFPRGIEINDKADWDYEIAPMDFFDISSTEIREKRNDSIKEVKDYIEKNDLYTRIH